MPDTQLVHHKVYVYSLVHNLPIHGRMARLSFCGWPCDMELVIRQSMRDPAISRDSFRRSLKTFLFSAYLCTYHMRAFWTVHSTIYLLT